MSAATSDPKAIFFAALDEPSPAERSRYVDDACGGDPDLRSRVEQLLLAHDQAGHFLGGDGATAATTNQPTERLGTTIGPYKLLQVIGEGGMGVVYMAEQTQPVQRKVAVKVIKPGMDSRQVIARFEAERQALALMDHVNIARVLDAGTIGEPGALAPGGASPAYAGGSPGRPYFVMELVHGVPITKYCDDNRLTPRERLELFVPVCQAIQHAHQKGIIHRDIKPSNVMVTLYDGQPVSKVIDFGVAKATEQKLTERTLFTQYGTMVGTLEYMSPEQAEMSALGVDTRSDIYSLGVLLYELLTGTTPFDKQRLRSAAFDEMLRIIREEEPPKPSTRLSDLSRVGSAHQPAANIPPSSGAHSGGHSPPYSSLASISAQRHMEPAKLTKLVRGELDWIVMKCLEKDRNRRYESVSAFAADMQRYLHDEPVQACPPSTLYRLRKLARRHKRALISVSAVALAALLAVAALAVSTGLVWRANQELRTEVYFQRITVAHRELSTDNLAAAVRALEDCPEDLRGWEWHYLMRLCKVEPLVLRDSTEVNGVAFSPDGERIASAGKDGMIKIWDLRTRRIIQKFAAHDKAACSVAFHPDGRHLASAGADRLVKVWDVQATDHEVFQGPCDAIRKFGASCTVAFRPPDGRQLAAGCDEEVRLWDWADDKLLHAFPGPEHDSIPVAVSRDGRRLATGGPWEQGLNLWDAETWLLLRSLPADRHPASALAFSTDGGRLAAASLGRSASLWDTTTGKLLQTLPHTGNVLGVAFSPDGRRLVSAGEDKTVHVWDAATGREVLGLHGHTDMCGCVAFSPDPGGWRLASASHDGTIRVWDATPLRGDEGQETLTFTQHDHEVRSVAVNLDGERIVSGGNGTLVKVWDATTGRVSFNFPGHSAPVFSVAWHPDGRRVATAGSAGRQNVVKVWDASDGRVHFEIPVGQNSSAGPYQAVAFSPDGRYLVTGKLGGAVQVWDARTGQEVRTLGSHDREIRGLIFSKGGEYLASASGDGKVKLWDATRLSEEQEPGRTFQSRVPGPSLNVAFSPDARRLATGGESNTVKIWDVQTGQELHTLRGHSGEVYTVAFSPDEDGRWVASGGEDSAVKVWDSHTGKLVRSFRGHTGLVSSLAFSPNGGRLVSGSRDKTVKVWDVSQLEIVPDR